MIEDPFILATGAVLLVALVVSVMLPVIREAKKMRTRGDGLRRIRHKRRSSAFYMGNEDDDETSLNQFYTGDDYENDDDHQTPFVFGIGEDSAFGYGPRVGRGGYGFGITV
jgi:hypothetical protein